MKELRYLTEDGDTDYFVHYLEVQKDKYDKIEEWLLSGQLDGDDEEYNEDED